MWYSYIKWNNACVRRIGNVIFLYPSKASFDEKRQIWDVRYLCLTLPCVTKTNKEKIWLLLISIWPGREMRIWYCYVKFNKVCVGNLCSVGAGSEDRSYMIFCMKPIRYMCVWCVFVSMFVFQKERDYILRKTISISKQHTRDLQVRM